MGPFAAIGQWRRMMVEGANRPLWGFLAHRGYSRTATEERLGDREVLIADLRCSICAGRPDCVTRLAAGEAPGPGCPNAGLFARLAR
jgi:hypothetical protein